RLNDDLGTTLKITVGADIQVKNPSQTVLLRNLGYTGIKCIVFESSNPLPPGVRVGSIAISTISRSSTGVVTVLTQQPHGLATGDWVQIKNVPGSIQTFNGVFSITRRTLRKFSYTQAGPAESGTSTPFFTVITGPNTLAEQKAAHLYTLESTGVNTWVI